MVRSALNRRDCLHLVVKETRALARTHAGGLWENEGPELPVKAESFAESLKFEESFEHLNVAFSAHA